MYEPKVYVVEGRLKGRGYWRVQVPHWSRNEARSRLKSYRENNPGSEFRVTTYAPKAKSR